MQLYCLTALDKGVYCVGVVVVVDVFIDSG
jgi:hypothetical protein